MASIVAGGETALKPAHSRDQIGPRRFQKPMVMITHQNVGMNFPTGALTKLGDRLQKTHPVRIISKDVLAPVAAATQHDRSHPQTRPVSS